MTLVSPTLAPPHQRPAITRTLLDHALLDATVALLKAREQVAEALRTDPVAAKDRERVSACVDGVLREATDLAIRVHHVLKVDALPT